MAEFVLNVHDIDEDGKDYSFPLTASWLHRPLAGLAARARGLRPEADELELTPEDLDREFFTGDRIVLDDLVREQLILEAPMQPLCRQDCPGIPVPAHLRPPPELAP